jgi:hypothetical protein
MKPAPDPNPMNPAGPNSVGGDGLPADEKEAAREMVRVVAAWCTEKILREHRSAAPDRERLERLKRQQQECAADQRALTDAGPQEVARITAAYAARFRELTDQ